MKIGYDGKRAAQNFTGLGNYSRYALEAMVANYPGDDFLVYIPKDTYNEKFEDILHASGGKMKKILPCRWWNKKLKSLWRVWHVGKDICQHEIDLFHGLSNELPLNIKRVAPAVKSVVTIHDLIFLKYPSCYPYIDRKIYNFKFRRACLNADHIIAVSECTKRDIVVRYGISPDKISVIYQGCDPLFAMEASEELCSAIRKKYSLPDKFILSVGSIEKRKNLLSVVKALTLLPDDIHLVAVGKRTKYTSLIDDFVKKNGLDGRVHLLRGISSSELPVIYRCADVFVYMSVYEGFGIPILEALNSRLPVVAATGSCLEEAGGCSSKYVAPFDIEAIAQAVKDCYIPAVREKMIEKGLEWAHRFTPENFARETMSVYHRVLAGDDTAFKK